MNFMVTQDTRDVVQLFDFTLLTKVQSLAQVKSRALFYDLKLIVSQYSGFEFTKTR